MTRRCGSVCKLSYAVRVTPPAQIRDGLQEFSRLTKETLEHIMQSDLDDMQWALASMGIKDGGLGLRDGTKHASAAFCDSFLNCCEYCIEIDPCFDISDANDFAGALGAKIVLDGLMSDEDRLDFSAPVRSQKNLSKAVDKELRRNSRVAAHADRFFSFAYESGVAAWCRSLAHRASSG